LKIVWIFIGVCFLNNLQSQIIWATKPLINASEVFPFEEEMAHFSLNGKFGYIDRFGNVSIPATYLSARPFHNGLAIVSELKGFGAIDKRGETILNFFSQHFLILINIQFHFLNMEIIFAPNQEIE